MSAGGQADTIYKCLRSDGEIVISFNRKLEDMRCSVYQGMDKEPEKPKGSRCWRQRFGKTVVDKCEKDGIWSVFARTVEPAVVEAGAANSVAAVAGPARAPELSGTVVSAGEVGIGQSQVGTLRVPDLKAIVTSAAAEFGIPEPLLMAVIEVESGYNPDVVSPVGAQGLMQLMPVTADYLNVDDPFDPVQNVKAGAKLLRILSDRFEGNHEKVIAAYYAGAGAVTRAGGVPASCQDYVRKVMARYRKHSAAN